MTKRTIVWLIIATSLVLIGCAIFGGVMTILHWDFNKLSTVKYETNRHEISEPFHNVSITTHTANVVFEPSASDTASVVCYEQMKVTHSAEVIDGTLVIQVHDTRKWYEHIGIFTFSAPKITVLLPQQEYEKIKVKNATGNVTIPEDFRLQTLSVDGETGSVTCSACVWDTVKVKLATGNIRVEASSVGALDLTTSTGDVTVKNVSGEGAVSIKTSTGKITLSDVVCNALTVQGNTGDAVLKKVLVSEKISIEQDTGDVSFDKCDAKELSVKTDTGDVSGSLMTPKIFYTQTDTGSVKVPHCTTGGKCEIKTDTGDIKIELLISEDTSKAP